MSDSGSLLMPRSAPHADMQAVVVIHGMGEQRPMDTIKAFAKAVWETDKVITANDLTHAVTEPVEAHGLLACVASTNKYLA